MIFPLLLLLQAAGSAAETPPPEPRPMGIFATDADGDGRIGREELSAWLDRDFTAHDKDGDGLIPLRELMQPAPSGGGTASGGMPRREGATAGEGRRGGSGRMGGMSGMGGMGGGGFGHRGGGGNFGDRPLQGEGVRRAGGGMTAAAMPGGMPRSEDSNDDGMIDSSEYAASALAWFDDLDADHDGTVTRAELPHPPMREHPPEGE
jgi:hypothetical protein